MDFFDLRKTRSYSLLTRRNLVRGAALATFLSPIIRKMEAYAQAASAPRRIILIFSPNGPMMANGPTTGSETNFTFHDWWRPLERHKADGIFMSHMAPAGLGLAPGREHGYGGQVFSGFGANSYDCLGETIDELMGRRLEQAGRAGAVRNVFWGLEGGGHNAFSTGPRAPKTPQLNPQLAWGALFQNFVANNTGDTAAHQRALADLGRKRSVLDFVNKDCGAMKNALGSEGSRLLDEHCSTIRTMESALVTPPPPPQSSCMRPAQPAAVSTSSPDTADARCTTFFQLMAMALACERTHVIAFQFGAQAARNRLPASYGVPTAGVQDSMDSGPAHHPWTHEQTDMAGKKDALRKFTNYYSSQVSNLVDTLKATNDGSGKNLLDSTMVVWLPEFGGSPRNDTDVQGWTHGHMITQSPVVLFGSGQGTFRTGRHRQGPSTGISDGSTGPADTQAGREMTQVLVSLIQYMGFTDVQTIGATQTNGRFPWLYV